MGACAGAGAEHVQRARILRIPAPARAAGAGCDQVAAQTRGACGEPVPQTENMTRLGHRGVLGLKSGRWCAVVCSRCFVMQAKKNQYATPVADPYKCVIVKLRFNSFWLLLSVAIIS